MTTDDKSVLKFRQSILSCTIPTFTLVIALLAMKISDK